MPRMDIAAFFSTMSRALVDPITGLGPRSEIELSAILAYEHARGTVDWSLAKPRFVGTAPVEPLSSLLAGPGTVLTEYPLFAAAGPETDRWGQMRGDVVMLSADRSRIVLVEAKVDSHFTYGERPPDAQLARQLDYLASLDQAHKLLILLSPHHNLDWYFERLSWCWSPDYAAARVSACVVCWETLLDLADALPGHALRPQAADTAAAESAGHATSAA